MIETEYNFSESQRDIWLMEQVVGSSIAVICGSILFPFEGTAPKAEQLKDCVRQLYFNNEALRIKIKKDEKGEFSQIVT